MGVPRQWAASPGTGDAVYVRDIDDLARFKLGNVYTIDVPVWFTHTGTMDFRDSGLLVLNNGLTTGGSLHGMDGISQQLTASLLAAPFITFRGNAVVENLAFIGLFQLFDFDGTTAGPNAIVNFTRLLALGCVSLGTWSTYASLIGTQSVFVSCGGLAITGIGDTIMEVVGFRAMAGGIVLSGALNTATFRVVSFQPSDGVTALTVPDGSSFVDTLDITRCRFVLDTAAAVGLAVHSGVILEPEALDVRRGIFTKSAGGDPVGVPIPSGYMDASFNEAHYSRCKGTPNSVTVAVITMTGNGVATDVGGQADTPVKVAGATIEREVSKFTTSDNRITFAGGIDEVIDILVRATIVGGSNEEFKLYIAIGSATPAVPAAVVLHTVAEGSTGAGGRSSQVVVTHVVGFLAGGGGFAELWMSTDGTNLTATDMHFKASMLPA